MEQKYVAPEVVEAVTKEIKSLGDNTKANYEELNRRYEELKGIVDTVGPNVRSDIQEQMTKLTEDITTRQAALDETINKRMDSVETGLQRQSFGSIGSDSMEAQKEAKEFYIHRLACKEEKGANFKRVADMEIDTDTFLEYKKAFLKFLRNPGDERSLAPDEHKSLSVGSDPDGGYLVTPAMSSKMITRIYEGDPIRQLASVETITTGALEWNVDWGEAGSGWEAETQAGGSNDTPDLKHKRIPVHVQYAKLHATQTLLEDSGINVEMWLANHGSRKFGRDEGAKFVNGNGVGTPRGFLTYSNGTTYGTIEQVNMGNSSALTADGFIDVKYSLKEYFLNLGTWLMNRTTVAAAMKLKNGDGDYIWKPGLTADTNSTILSLPVRMSTTMPTIASDALSVALADWSEAYKIVDRLGITVQRDPYTKKPFVEFYMRKRVGGDIVNYDAIKIGKISA